MALTSEEKKIYRADKEVLVNRLSQNPDSFNLAAQVTGQSLAEANILALTLIEKLLSVPRQFRSSVLKKVSEMQFVVDGAE